VVCLRDVASPRHGAAAEAAAANNTNAAAAAIAATATTAAADAAPKAADAAPKAADAALEVWKLEAVAPPPVPAAPPPPAAAASTAVGSLFDSLPTVSSLFPGRAAPYVFSALEEVAVKESFEARGFAFARVAIPPH
jgi:hypothetical protein